MYFARERPRQPSHPQPPKLPEQVRTALRSRHYSLRTEEAYLSWIKRFLLFQLDVSHLGNEHRQQLSWAAMSHGRFLSLGPTTRRSKNPIG
ncbi:MAG: phage integrase N-terminal SAM-like domain-containing protein [Candidatus Tectimicrobiota bacterium]